MNRPTGLAVEHLGASVLGLGDRRPRLSWRLPAGATKQEAYVLEIDGHALDRVGSDASILVPWPADPLTSRQRVVWRVKVWTDGTESDWSSPALFETGLLDAVDWTARFIEPVEMERSAHVLRHTFRLGAAPSQARLYATAHGIYETFLNGSRVGDVELAPGFTSYPTTLHVQVTTSARSSWPARTPGRSCSPTAGGADAPASSRRSTATAARSPSSVSSMRTASSSQRGRNGSRPPDLS